MKKILLSLFMLFVWIISFCNAGSYTFEWSWTNFPWIITPPKTQLSKNMTLSCIFTYTDCWLANAWLDIFKVKFRFSYYTNNNSSFAAWWEDISSLLVLTCGWDHTLNFSYDFSTFTPAQTYNQYHWVNLVALQSVYMADPNIIHYTCTFSGDNVPDWSFDWWWSTSCPECPTCPEVNTWEILSWYILESEIDTNYCVWNWLCPNECWSWLDFSGDLAFSNIYINDILHPWRQNVYINIPDYITWDYSTDTWFFNLYVWSWYDVDYINSIIDINSYRPDSKDFTDIFVWWLTLITPYIVAILFFYLVWRLLKRIFS